MTGENNISAANTAEIPVVRQRSDGEESSAAQQPAPSQSQPIPPQPAAANQQVSAASVPTVSLQNEEPADVRGRKPVQHKTQAASAKTVRRQKPTQQSQKPMQQRQKPTQQRQKPQAAPAKAARRGRVRTWHIFAVFVVLAIIALVVSLSLFVWTRWYRYDDSQDIQGTWYAIGTSVPVNITDSQIDFTIDTTYDYTIDESAKTIEFSLGGLSGQGHYRFDEDRQVLIIVDGEDFTQWGTAGEDLFSHFNDIASLSSGKGLHYPSGDGVIVLTREPEKQGRGEVKYKKAEEGA